jgi:hydrogenase maturation protease
MARAVILACGNPLRSDDGVALHIAHLVQSTLRGADVEFCCAQQWTPEMAESISRSGLAIFVDASASLAAGELQCREVCAPEEELGVTTHNCSPEELLALAQQLYRGAPRHAFLVTIGGKSFEHGEHLSEIVRRAMPAACQRIEELLARL